MNFCTINIDSSTLGSTFYTNATDESPVNEFLSYDLGSNIISIKLPSGRIDEFKGTHEVTIVLKDTGGAEKEYQIKVVLDENV